MGSQRSDTYLPMILAKIGQAAMRASGAQGVNSVLHDLRAFVARGKTSLGTQIWNCI